VAEAENVVKVRQTQVQGQLRIGSSVAFGRRVLIPLAMDFMKHNPQVQVDLSFEDRYTDLVANGIDVALRLGKLADSSWAHACWASTPGCWWPPTPICASTARRAAPRTSRSIPR
jgi:DNA-binding transcriptional LysR family regulator